MNIYLVIGDIDDHGCGGAMTVIAENKKEAESLASKNIFHPKLCPKPEKMPSISYYGITPTAKKIGETDLSEKGIVIGVSW